MIIGTAGHVDHGKTRLVEAITGAAGDRLKEERARGITIDLGFAYWPQADGTSIGFVDVPGHEDYIHNMLAGVTGVRALLLVISATEGIKAQTREHLEIAELLGVDSVLVALSKVDLADADLVQARIGEIRAFLAGTGLKDAPVFPVSSVTGKGLDTLRQALQSLQQADLAKEVASGLFRMPVDRVFSVTGAGTVVTGSVVSGNATLDDRLMLSPAGRDVRVRGIHAQNRRTSRAQVGDRAAINLAGIGVQEIRRGDVLLGVDLHHPTRRMDAVVRLTHGLAKATRVWTPVHVHCGAGSWPARMMPLQRNATLPGDRHLAQIVLDRPAAMFGGDRIILRDASAQRTLGGGIVLDRDPPQRNRSRPERLRLLEHLARFGPVKGLPGILEEAPYTVDLHEFSKAFGLPVAAFEAVLGKENLLVLPQDRRSFVFAPAVVLTLMRTICDRLAEHHARQPDQPGLSSERLRLALPQRLETRAFAALISHMLRQGQIEAAGAWLRSPGHVARLSPEHAALWGAISPLLSGDNRFRPPRVNELADQFKRKEDTIRGLMKRLARRGDVDEVATDHFLLRETMAELAAEAIATGEASPDRWFNAAAFRDRIGIGRKMAILILECFDRHGLTIRKGDLRRVIPAKARLYDGIDVSTARQPSPDR